MLKKILSSLVGLNYKEKSILKSNNTQKYSYINLSEFIHGSIYTEKKFSNGIFNSDLNRAFIIHDNLITINNDYTIVNLADKYNSYLLTNRDCFEIIMSLNPQLIDGFSVSRRVDDENNNIFVVSGLKPREGYCICFIISSYWRIYNYEEGQKYENKIYYV